MAKIANPQGKGGDLLTIHWLPVIKLQEKSEQQILSDYATSMLVLSAEFGFKPVKGALYHLYLWKNVLRLSLIPFGKCPTGDIYPIAECQLCNDLTWCVQFIPAGSMCHQVTEFLQTYSNKFEDHLDTNKTLTETLPFYEQDLPFYRRLYASGLAKSLSLSLKQGQLSNKKIDEILETKMGAEQLKIALF